MFIHEMTEAECLDALGRARVGRLGCAHDNQPYVIPIYFAIEKDHIYAFATLGQKIEWMRINPKVCLEVDERIGPERWQSVVVYGRYEELPDLPQYKATRIKAHELLQKHAMWWEPACIAEEHRDRPHSCTPIFYRINVTSISGHRATPERTEQQLQTIVERKTKEGWWASLVRRIGVQA